MQDSVFLHTNILIYPYSNDIHKKKIARNTFNLYENVFINNQVLTEFTNVLLRKFNCTIEEIESGLNDFYRNTEILNVTIDTIKYRLKISKKYKYAYYDSVIVASALENRCDILFTEDLQNGQIIEGILKIVNPFITFL